jgi:hypothetical protein
MPPAIICPLAFGLTGPGKGTCPALPGLFMRGRLPMGYDVGMDPQEIQDLIARIERLKARQAVIEEMQREMASRAVTVQKVIASEAESLRGLKDNLGDKPKTK